MQMNGIHVTPVIKGSCLFAKHWNAIWQFCWRQQAQKNNPHLPPKKQKPWAGGGGRQSFVVCAGVTENLLAACSAQSLESCTSSAGKFILLPLFYTVLYPGTPGSETAAKHQTVSTTSSSPTSLTTTTSSSPTSLTPPHPPLLFCLVTVRLLKVCRWGMNLPAQTRGKDTKLPALLSRVWKIHHLFSCSDYTSCHTDLGYSERNCASLSKSSRQHFMMTREKWPKMMYKRCPNPVGIIF